MKKPSVRFNACYYCAQPFTDAETLASGAVVEQVDVEYEQGLLWRFHRDCWEQYANEVGIDSAFDDALRGAGPLDEADDPEEEEAR